MSFADPATALVLERIVDRLDRLIELSAAPRVTAPIGIEQTPAGDEEKPGGPSASIRVASDVMLHRYQLPVGHWLLVRHSLQTGELDFRIELPDGSRLGLVPEPDHLT